LCKPKRIFELGDLVKNLTLKCTLSEFELAEHDVKFAGDIRDVTGIQLSLSLACFIESIAFHPLLGFVK